MTLLTLMAGLAAAVGGGGGLECVRACLRVAAGCWDARAAGDKSGRALGGNKAAAVHSLVTGEQPCRGFIIDGEGYTCRLTARASSRVRACLCV